MSAPTFPAEGASTVVRKWIFEVDTTPDSTATWLMVGSVKNSVFKPDAGSFEDDSTMQSGGAGSETKTAGMASAALVLARKVTAADDTAYDPGQEFLRTHSIGKYGPANSVTMRICEYDPDGGPRVEAYTGRFGVDWDPQGGGNTNLDTVNCNLHGQGHCAPITHPYA